MTEEKTRPPLTLPPDLLPEIDHRCNCRCPWCYCVRHECPGKQLLFRRVPGARSRRERPCMPGVGVLY